jgi:signal transduction histidine kinase
MPLIDDDVAAIARIDAVPAILEVVCRTTGMGFAAVARVTENRWVACGVRDEIDFGLKPGGELEVQTTICNEIRQHRRVVAIDEVAQDAAYRDHRTPAMYGFKSYISVPIVLPNGEFFGTLCSIDPHPAQTTRPEVVGMFKLFADLIAFHLDAQRRLVASEAIAADERSRSELREQIIAVLGHDLRNPLAAIGSGARILEGTPLNDRAKMVVSHIQTSVERMSVLINNVLDFARGRLGGGFAVEKNTGEPLAPMLAHVTGEIRAIHPDRRIELSLDIDRPVACDVGRVGQLLSNLLENAVSHGDPKGAIRVDARTSPSEFSLSVANPGPPIPATVLPHLFKPFFRAPDRSNQHGLGLGLYITSEIARAHQGSLDVRSENGETSFTFRIPG